MSETRKRYARNRNGQLEESDNLNGPWTSTGEACPFMVAGALPDVARAPHDPQADLIARLTRFRHEIAQKIARWEHAAEITPEHLMLWDVASGIAKSERRLLAELDRLCPELSETKETP